MSAPSTSGLSVELLLRVIDVKYGHFTLPSSLKPLMSLKRYRTQFYCLIVSDEYFFCARTVFCTNQESRICRCVLTHSVTHNFSFPL